MNDRSKWLALTTENAIDPDLLICDPHHHLWDFPESRYLVDEFLQEFRGGHRVVNTVYVECRHSYKTDSPDALRPVGETEYIDRVVSESKIDEDTTQVAAGIVGFADLSLGSAVHEVLEAHMKASERFRGIRHMSAWDASEKIHNSKNNPPANLLLNDKFREGFVFLRSLDLTFDAWLYHPQISDLVDLAKAFPDVSIILNHVGGPLGIGPYAGKRDEVFTLWHKSIAELAHCSNVVVKLGGLTMSMSGFGWQKQDKPPGSIEVSESLAPYFETCIEHFGVERCMFESNFPIDKVSCSYTILWNAFKRVTERYSNAERSALFHDTATRVYKLNT